VKPDGGVVLKKRTVKERKTSPNVGDGGGTLRQRPVPLASREKMSFVRGKKSRKKKKSPRRGTGGTTRRKTMEETTRSTIRSRK